MFVKTLLWIIAALVAAVGLVTAAARSSAGYVQIVLPPYRIELSLVLVIVLLIAAFAVAYLGVRLVSAMVAMPRQVAAYRTSRRQQKAQASLYEALVAFFSGRYARAETAAAAAIDLSGQPHLAATLAARAAHELRAPERCDKYLAGVAGAAGTAPPRDSDLLTLITTADLLLKERRASEALGILQSLPQKHTAALRLELKALQLNQAWEKSLGVIDQLEQRGVYDALQAGELRCAALAAHLKRRATDIPTLDEAWRKVPDAVRRDARVTTAAAEGYIALQSRERAAEIIARGLDQRWNSDLAALYGECAAGTVHLERAERWLAAHAADPLLLLALGRLCAREALWGKARNYLDASLSVEPTYQAYLASAALHEQLGNHDAARQHSRAGMAHMLVRLRQPHNAR